MKRLLGILGLKRGHGSEGESKFIQDFLLPYKPKEFKDGKGEVMAYVITTDESSRTLFSCHTDTVHRSNDIMNPVLIDENIAYKADGEPLGADDGAGIWIMLEMVDAGIPGTYVFHRGEERGGIGSSWLARNEPEFLSRFDFAIAFDRRGYTDVITHQGGERGCSDEFAWALAKMLPKGFKQSREGIFTDTANYFHLIPECTNVSVGYLYEHSGSEQLDSEFLFELRDAIINNFDESLLPVQRSCELVVEDEADILSMTQDQIEDWVARTHPYEVANLIYDLAWKLNCSQSAACGSSMVIDEYEWRADF